MSALFRANIYNTFPRPYFFYLSLLPGLLLVDPSEDGGSMFLRNVGELADWRFRVTSKSVWGLEVKLSLRLIKH
jgi:hypothetical protein